MTTIRFCRAAALGAATLALMTAVGGCAQMPTDKFPDPGQVVVHVVDQSTSTGVSGATVDLLFPDTGQMWRSATTDASGNASPGAPDGGVLPGNYNVRVTPPSGYKLATGQSSAVPITVQSNKQISLSIMLTTGP